MLIPFQNLPANSKIWIYQANRALTQPESILMAQYLNENIQNWAAHGAPLLGSFSIEKDRFIIIGLDENKNGASGCSIDASAHWFKDLGLQLNVNFFDRSITYLVDNEIYSVDLLGVKKAVLDEKIHADTIIFNNLISTFIDFEKNWQIQASKSWLKKYFVPTTI